MTYEVHSEGDMGKMMVGAELSDMCVFPRLC